MPRAAAAHTEPVPQAKFQCKTRSLLLQNGSCDQISSTRTLPYLHVDRSVPVHRGHDSQRLEPTLDIKSCDPAVHAHKPDLVSCISHHRGIHEKTCHLSLAAPDDDQRLRPSLPRLAYTQPPPCLRPPLAPLWIKPCSTPSGVSARSEAFASTRSGSSAASRARNSHQELPGVNALVHLSPR